MKSILTIVVFCLAIVFSATAQETVAALKPLLTSYYEIKNALINADAPAASAKAGEFVKLINKIESKDLSPEASKSFASFQTKLSGDAGNISSTKDINKQRDYFAGFSLDLFSLAKALKLSDQPIFQAYCPMKKMYWLTNEKIIKNPYYGKQMLNCGSITEIINP